MNMNKILILIVTACSSLPKSRVGVTWTPLFFPDDPRLHNIDWYQNPQDYPVHKIKNILKNQTLPIPGFFDKSGEDDREELPSYIGTRFLSDNGDQAMEFTNICYENIQYIYPKQGTTKKGQNMFIINEDDDEFRQSVRITRCVGTEEPCGNGDYDFQTSYDNKCSQEYSDIKLVALSENGEELIVETFQFPSCCICKVKTSLFLRSSDVEE